MNFNAPIVRTYVTMYSQTDPYHQYRYQVVANPAPSGHVRVIYRQRTTSTGVKRTILGTDVLRTITLYIPGTQDMLDFGTMSDLEELAKSRISIIGLESDTVLGARILDMREQPINLAAGDVLVQVDLAIDNSSDSWGCQ